MEGVGLGLAVVAEARTCAQSIIRRIGNYRHGRKAFERLSDNLAHVSDSLEEVEQLLRKFPNALPQDISALFNGTLDRVRHDLVDSEGTIENEFSKAFAGSSSSFLGDLKSKGYRVFRATALNNKMNAIETQLKESSNQLLHLTTQLASALNTLEILPKFDNLSTVEPAREEFRPVNCAPAVSHTVYLDFETKDSQGYFAAPEGDLKNKVLSCTLSNTVTAAVGALNPAYGVVGMAGVGKTIALQGLAGEKDIRSRFPDGVQYMSLGQEATEQVVIKEIVRVMRLAGAIASTAAVDSSSSLREAIEYAFTWFQGRKCLILVDDLWPSEGRPTGFLTELRQLLRESPDSRMAISTRSVNIALGAGSVVDFGARDPLGPVSVAIFISHATGYSPGNGEDLAPSVTRILTWCAGLPIALSVSGSAVAYLARTLGSFERACDIYATDFEERRTCLGVQRDIYGTTLTEGILLSLKYLEVAFLDWKSANDVDCEHAISDMYTSLCVLTNQLWMPVSVLGRMWQLCERWAFDVANLFCGMSLATLSFRKNGEDATQHAGLTLHDLHLNFCKHQAKSKNCEVFWNSALLDGYLESSTYLANFEPAVLSPQQLVGLTSRPWWGAAIPEDGYVHANLARHLSLSGLRSELASLLLDARWVDVRGQHGGILGLEADFAILDKLLDPDNSSKGQDEPSEVIQTSFKQIAKATRLAFGSFCDGPRSFMFQMCGRMESLRNRSIIVGALIKSFEVHTPKPYLTSVSSFFPELYTAQILEIPVGGTCFSSASSPCGRYIASGASHDIVIADALTGVVLKRLQGHSEDVWCIRFVSESGRIVSASADKTIAVWEWDTSSTPVLVLKGHRDVVMSVAVSSDGKRIFSGSIDRTVRSWNEITGLQTRAFPQSSAVDCIALSTDDRKVAVGLREGAVKVLDSSTGENLFECENVHSRIITSIAFSPDGQRLATCSMDRTIRIWNTEAWTASDELPERHKSWVNSVAFSPDGQQLVSGSSDRTVQLWNIATEESSSRPLLNLRSVFSADVVRSVTFTYNGKRIISGSFSGIVRVWDADFLADRKQRNFGHSQPALGVSLSPDGLRAASGSHDNSVRQWNTLTGAQIGTPHEGHTDSVLCVSFSPDGEQLVSGSRDNTLKLWETERSTQLETHFGEHADTVHCVSFSSDGRRILSGGSDNTVRLWNAQTRQQIGDPLIGHTTKVRAVAESSDGRFVVSRGLNEETIIWSRDNCKVVWKSKSSAGDDQNSTSDNEAKNIIRSCGKVTPRLWPDSFLEYTAEVFCKDYKLYTNVLGEKTFLGNLPSSAWDWEYDGSKHVFAAGLNSGAIAICRLVKQSQ